MRNLLVRTKRESSSPILAETQDQDYQKTELAGYKHENSSPISTKTKDQDYQKTELASYKCEKNSPISAETKDQDYLKTELASYKHENSSPISAETRMQDYQKQIKTMKTLRKESDRLIISSLNQTIDSFYEIQYNIKNKEDTKWN